ncbi:MAG: redox-regulated ATPase YchF [Phycisphaerales bacterium]|nr:redox-regulated ATPase YchF [Phycisphaerales bacterium]
MDCGLIGRLGVGKTTLFQALSGHSVPVTPGAMKPNMGMASIPDARLDRIAEFVPTQKIIPATVRVVDIPGVPSGGDSLGQVLAHIRTVDALAHVVRCWDDPGLGPADPAGDIDAMDSELLLSDLVVVEGALGKAQRSARGNDADAKQRLAVLQKADALLQEGTPLRDASWEGAEAAAMKSFGFMTAKPVLHVANVGENDVDGASDHVTAVREAGGGTCVVLCATLESEIAELDEADRADMLESMGLQQPAVGALAAGMNQVLGLSTFYTAGEKEVRAWVIPVDCPAPEAAGVIHSDIQRGFIRAECYACDEIFELGSEKAIKDAGKLRSEGKGYAMRDGDVVHFLFNV